MSAEQVADALRELYGERIQLRHGLQAVIIRDPEARARRLARRGTRKSTKTATAPPPRKPQLSRDDLNPEQRRAYDAWLASQNGGNGA